MKTRILASLAFSISLTGLPAASALAQRAAPAQAQAEAPADTPAWQKMRNVAHGALQTLEYQSKSLDRARQAIVYLPPGYEGSRDRYPVLYLLHGAGGDEHTWVDRMHADVILDNLIADGRLDPLVVVMPYNYTHRLAEGERRRGAADYKTDMEEFPRDLINDLIPLVESRYRVIADREHRAIAGLSMGAGQSLAIGLTHPELFSDVASFSSAMQIANNPDWGGVDMDAVLANSDAINGQLDLLWVGCGMEDTLFNVNKQFSDQLTEHGVEHTFRVTHGMHEPAVWSRYLHEVAPQLFLRE
jgi:enterochelin esterase-like enzyme